MKLFDVFDTASPDYGRAMDADPVAAKRRLRERIRQLRLVASPAADEAQASLDTLAVQLLARLAPRTVFCYLSTPGEVSTTRIIDTLFELGCTVAVPFLVNRANMLASRITDWNGLAPGRLGILAPTTPAPVATPIDCVLVPGLAFSLTGARLGFGAGYYDRWLAAHPNAKRIGLCFEYQVDERTPREAHDEPLDYLITERRIAAMPARQRSGPV